ncbi:MAG: hypothetical protein JO223_06155 [Hyphomicrobiales bacterium]|nr:hypothetical protein [Hyphomicrobiales bacterium]MBV8441245.1 hypothetical protein [Hyphomicrobiales bacterium]
MPSRVWLAVAFLIAFGAPPARTETNGPAATMRTSSRPEDASPAERGLDPALFAEAGGRNAAQAQ